MLTLWAVASSRASAIDWSAGVRRRRSSTRSVIGTALSWSLWFGLVGSGEAGRVASYIFFVPIVSLVIGGLVLGETLGASS